MLQDTSRGGEHCASFHVDAGRFPEDRALELAEHVALFDLISQVLAHAANQPRDLGRQVRLGVEVLLDDRCQAQPLGDKPRAHGRCLDAGSLDLACGQGDFVAAGAGRAVVVPVVAPAGTTLLAAGEQGREQQRSEGNARSDSARVVVHWGSSSVVLWGRGVWAEGKRRPHALSRRIRASAHA